MPQKKNAIRRNQFTLHKIQIQTVLVGLLLEVYNNPCSSEASIDVCITLIGITDTPLTDAKCHSQAT